MAGDFTTVDLSQLVAPGVVETLDFEAILAAMVADLQARDATFTALVESDPAYKVLEVAAYREILIRQRVNEAAKAVMLAYAARTDLDQIGANFNVERLVVDEGDPDAVPPVPPTYETDTAFRARIQLALEGITTAGSEGSYVFHGLSADGDVRDIQAISPEPGDVEVYVLAHSGDGTASTELVNTVTAALNAQDVRPLTDNVTVQTAMIVEYSVDATLEIENGPDPDVVLAAAEEAVTTYVEQIRRIGYTIPLSGLFAALHQPGVRKVTLASPSADVEIEDGEAGYCASIAVAQA